MPLLFLALFMLAPACRAQENPQKIGQRDLQLRKNPPAQSGPAIAIPRGYALVIGVGSYKNLRQSQFLPFADTDAEAIYRVLISRQGGAFPAENVHKLIGPQATLENIRREVEVWLPSVAKPEDRVVIFFAGHGFVHKGAGYLAPWDVDLARITESGYPMRTLGAAVGEKIKAKWKVLLADACHSGKITPETTDEQVDTELSKLQGFLTLTASSERERSYEDPGLSTGFGLFTYFLTQGWQGNADSDPCDGQTTADELVEYVRRHVKAYARERGYYQTPNARGDYDPQMPLGLNFSCPGEGSVVALGTGGLVIESNMDDVEVYIDDKLVGTVSKSKPLSVPGLNGGEHVVKGAHKGYEPDVKTIVVAPGEQRPVSLRIRFAKEIKRSAVELFERGSKLLQTRRSAFNPLSVYLPRSQSQDDIRRARELFSQALAEDPGYADAAYELGVACQLLSDTACSKRALRNAIEIDPSHVDARILYSAVIVEEGDADESIRQLTEVLRLQPRNDLAHSMMARAYWDKAAWDRCLEAADAAIRLNESNDQAHLWRAEALRHQAAEEKSDAARRTRLFTHARDAYREFLSRSNISTPVFRWLAFKAVGFHLGSRSHADRKLSYENQRSAGYLGLCICENRLGNHLRAREYCDRAVALDPQDATAWYLLGNVHLYLFNAGPPDREHLLSARRDYLKSLSINPDLEFSKNVKSSIENIDSMLAELNRQRSRTR